MGFRKFANAFIEHLTSEGLANAKGYLSLTEISDYYSRFYYANQELLKSGPCDYLYDICTMNNEPIFETKEFTFKQRRKVFKAGQELYFQRLLQWRFGQKRGWLVHIIGRYLRLRKLLIRIVHTKWGHRLFCRLSHQDERKDGLL